MPDLDIFMTICHSTPPLSTGSRRRRSTSSLLHHTLSASSPSPSILGPPLSAPHLFGLDHSFSAFPRSVPLRPTTTITSSSCTSAGGHRPAMISTIATTVGSGGLPVRPSSTSPRGRPRRCAVRAQAAGADASDGKSVEIMRKFSEQYARRSDTFFCADKSVTAVVIKGLADHKDQLGAPLCPCRHYDDKAAEAAQGFWNCPCVPMRERKECHCMLFLTPDNDFAGKDQAITLEEIKDATSKI
ncbi:ferredoxin-thioredoxin reductase catalytic chain, chloroplastic [Phragmites australis]|uniref:ferredoxin-thioredoxin reductase catalytic chain, chloroplastic n=1 Tax=Phragmites australis TaxID=29695 RepID=UPI002D776AF0|nr:ferredoxin-thioredoxin reductase catalytic chain, chloroplastic [Phragmites australis]